MIRFESVSKVFKTSAGQVTALSDINLTIEDGCIYGIIGLSGAGKSTLVRCLNLLERPTEGSVYLDDVNLMSLKSKELRLARRKMGMIFQQFNLLEQRDALSNVCYPLEIAGVDKKKAREKAKSLLELVGLEDRLHNYPAQLSGGQKQRVAIARALASDPKILLCDEATSALDPNTTSAILDLLKKINKELGVTVVVITHEMRVVEQICDQVAVIDRGCLVESGPVRDVFMKPKSTVTRNLVFPRQGKSPSNIENQRLMRLTFDGQSSEEPVIANLILACETTVNILGASTENIGGKAYGQMLIALPSDEFVLARVKGYLSEVGVSDEEVSGDGN